MLTEKILSGPNKGKDNIKVLKVLKRRDIINEFREGNIGLEEFKKVTKEIFPIADRNVFQSFSIHKHSKIPRDWEEYQNYIDYFFQRAYRSSIIEEEFFYILDVLPVRGLAHQKIVVRYPDMRKY